MFKATRDFTLADGTIFAGDVVENPTARMIDLGLVVEVQETEETEEVVEKVAKEPKKAKGAKTVEQETKEDVKEVKEEILTEQSSDVTVEKVEEAPQA